MQRISVSVTTAADGSATVYTGPISGAVLQVSYVPHASTPLDTGADIDITGDTTGIVIANHDNIGTSAFTRCYSQAIHGVDGAASVYAAGGSGVFGPIYVVGEKLKLVVANGGNAKSGTFTFIIG